jgi:rhamnulokinase
VSVRLLAVDLGAESGRGVLGTLDDRGLTVEEVHRFPNLPVPVRGTLYWDVLGLYRGVRECLERAVRRGGEPLRAIGVDAWGVDFALLDRAGQLLGNPVHYRDRRTEGAMEDVLRRVPAEEVYQRTGIQFLPFNTLYQLYALAARDDPQLAAAETLLTIPDLLHYWLSGRRVAEFTNATTTQCYDPVAGGWARSLLERLGIPPGIFPPVVPPGTVLGPLEGALAEEFGAAEVLVVAPASHDTGSAVAAVPLSAPEAAYLSSGTWSLLGLEVTAPRITPEAMAFNVTHEGGVAGTFRLLKNVMGLWLLQECRRAWAAEGQTWDYEALVRLAEAAPRGGPLLDPDDPRFLPPGDMPARIRRYCAETGQSVPAGPGEVVRTVLESLALKYRWVLGRLEALIGRRVPAIHVVGGGARNQVLCQWTADATGRPVLAGPVEATAIGNLLVQAMGLGAVADLAEARELVRRSFPPQVYEPRDPGPWEEAWVRFVALVGAPVPREG